MFKEQLRFLTSLEGISLTPLAHAHTRTRTRTRTPVVCRLERAQAAAGWVEEDSWGRLSV